MTIHLKWVKFSFMFLLLCQLSFATSQAADFIEPISLSSNQGVLETTLTVQYTEHTIGNDRVKLRSYNGTLMGPTLRVQPGDVLKITLVNNLPMEHENSEGYDGFHAWNTTNLHTHGLHVSPTGKSDNVLLDIAPGERFEYEIRIPEDHPAGTFWYHAHRHGSVAAQVSGGLSGALIVEGGMDNVPEIAAAAEKLFFLQQIPYYNNNLSVGVVELEYANLMFGPGAWDKLQRYTTVNGVIAPVLYLQPGEVQRWRFVQSGPGDKIVLSLKPAKSNNAQPIPFYEIAVDGLPLGKKVQKETNELWSGYRSDVLVQAPQTPGEYVLLDERDNTNPAVGEDDPRKVLARVIITGQAKNMALPDDAQLAGFRLPTIRAEDVTGYQQAIFNIDLTTDPIQFTINGKEFDPNTPRILRLRDVDQWTLKSNLDAHPFHIHVNPFEVFSIKDDKGVEQLTEPVWRDTITVLERWTVQFRTRYEDFTGPFVIHCHILEHEDNGMMELIELQEGQSNVNYYLEY